MHRDNIIKYIELLREHPNVALSQETSARYSVQYKGTAWHVWPISGRYRFVDDPSKPDDFFGDIKHFYQRYILNTFDFPENHGKKWTKGEEASLLDMVEGDLSVNLIAADLLRHPKSIVVKIAILLDDYGINAKLDDPSSFDTPVKYLI
jgi:hypothetical protein